MDNDYHTVFSVNITDWLNKPDLLPIRHNFDLLLKGFLETPGRVAQPSYNFQVPNLIGLFALKKFNEKTFNNIYVYL